MSAVVPSASKPDFNEVLSIGYMCGQSMSWHDDGEQDVAPVVASLSFGSDAVRATYSSMPTYADHGFPRQGL